MTEQDVRRAIVNAEGMAAKLRAVEVAAKELASSTQKPQEHLESLASSLRKAQGLPPAEATKHLKAATDAKRRFEAEKSKVEKLVRKLWERITALQHPTEP